MTRGFTLIEITVAIFLITVGTLGAFNMIQRIITFTSVISSQLTASYLAQEGIEIARNIRDTNWLEQRGSPGLPWSDGLVGCGSGCEADYNDAGLSSYTGRFLKIDNGFYNYDAGTNTVFKRKITIFPQVDVLEVSVEVSWQERGRDHRVTAQTELYNWK
jgi:prepilin-type N-terminal cleavage/methylation domain-containing protein